MKSALFSQDLRPKPEYHGVPMSSFVNKSMRLIRAIAWHRENIFWTLQIIVVLLIGLPLILSSAAQVRAQVPTTGEAALVQEAESRTADDRAQAPGERSELNALLSDEVPLAEVIAPQSALGRAELDLNALAQAYSVDESDNVRWALVRRTSRAAEVYGPEKGVDWAALRRVQHTGTILMPAGFAWSFNETFQQGPGYKRAGGILAGGHCALATAFRAAAVQAGLSATSRRHATPFPGFALEESVNILWGRDDLIVHNNTQQDLYFVWEVGSDRVTVAVVPVTDTLPLPSLPDWRDRTIAMVYGRPGPGGWGNLGQTVIVDHALYRARVFAGRVDEWNGSKSVAVALNPNVVTAGKLTKREMYLYHLIAEARRQGYYVMLDVKTGDRDPLTVFEQLLDRFLREHVWLDWDIESTVGDRVSAGQINEIAAAYFARRRDKGFQTPGIFAFYVFKEGQVTDPDQVIRRYDGGLVVPIFDGFGTKDTKIAKTQQVLASFGEGRFGIMEFETRWGTRYDKISARAYLDAFPEALIFASQ